MTKKRIHVFFLLTLVGVAITVLMPYTVCLDMSDNTIILKYKYGYDLPSVTFSCLLSLIVCLSAVAGYKVLAVVVSSFTLFWLYVVRIDIHWQGMIDHEYDTKSGMGFLMLVVLVISQFVMALILLTGLKKHRTK